MMSRSIKKVVLPLILMFSVTLISTSCGERQKQITLSSDVKQETKDEEKNASKLVKVTELDLNNMIYTPICWKDDENIIVTEGSDKNTIDLNSIHIDDINIYNVNIKTSKVSKINTIKEAICGDIGQKHMYGNFLYTKDNKLWMYNTIENASKPVYDLSDIMKKQKEGLKTADTRELLKRIHSGFVFGSDKYVYVIADVSNIESIMVAIDTKTGDAIEGYTNSGYFPYSDKTQGIFSWVYNKSNDSFYISSPYYNVIYKTQLGKKSAFKKIETVGGQIFDISEDGNEIYLNSIYKNGKRSIVKYDIQKDKVTVIADENRDNGRKNHTSMFTDVHTDTRKGIISYSIQSAELESKNKTYRMEAASFIGDFDGKEIKNARMLPIEQLDNKSSQNTIMINRKGDGFIYTLYYFDYEGEVIKFYKTKSYIYQIKQ
ncbi:hypothetical protein P8V03_02265 [Clostridium sp. A1-XYC3]|uniref:Lipoprotein n=1 Tax=Clostridium tanneri TaxID=3037988 RepID=A0ABU4JPD0_9CLOT|nr:hypothetical protein [Clostridium sp. A1-XYC3]MDW8799975.1 hypothetical protein [Clostridium sp. A1-XYC3]